MSIISRTCPECGDSFTTNRIDCHYCSDDCRNGQRNGQSANPRIGWDDPPDDDTLDEFIASDVESVHFEALDDCRWYANIKLTDGQLWTLNFGSVSGRARGYANAERVE